MASLRTHRSKQAETPAPKRVKTSLILDADLHVKLSAKAAMNGVSSNALACEILSEALKSVVVFDRADKRKPAGARGLVPIVGEAMNAHPLREYEIHTPLRAGQGSRKVVI